MEKSPDAFRTISEVAEDLDVPQHVLRFWETRFTQIRPLKRGGGRRYYRPEDVELLRAIRHLLYGEGYTIKGVQRILKEHGPRAVTQMTRAAVSGEAGAPEPVADEIAPRAAAPNQPAPTIPSAPAQEGTPREPAFLRRVVPEPLRIDPQPGPPRLVAPAAAPLHAPPPAPLPQDRHASPQRPVAPAGLRPVLSYLAPQDVERLKAALFELAECERQLAAARRA